MLVNNKHWMNWAIQRGTLFRQQTLLRVGVESLPLLGCVVYHHHRGYKKSFEEKNIPCTRVIKERKRRSSVDIYKARFILTWMKYNCIFIMLWEDLFLFRKESTNCVDFTINSNLPATYLWSYYELLASG